jgi:hypothetical protein
LKKKLIAVAVVSLGLLAGCSGYETGDTIGEDNRFKVVGDIGNYDVLKDVETGCLYTESHHESTGLSPLFNKKGEVSGCGDVSKKEEF